MQKKVIIIGAGGHAKVIADIVVNSNDQLVGFLDDNLDKQDMVIFDNKKVLGTINQDIINKYNDCYFIIGIGDNEIRKKIANQYPNLKYYTAIHPNAVIGNEVEIDAGTTIMAGVVINPGARIGKHCIVNTSASLDHDNNLEDYVHISPGAHLAGTVIIKEGTWICTGVTIINNITINSWNIIAAGATIIKDINDTNCTFINTINSIKKQK
ncbi:MAG: acetyltransferase [Bacilli bacterium]|nr:acetyltransferase [Bacilli bacterium]